MLRLPKWCPDALKQGTVIVFFKVYYQILNDKTFTYFYYVCSP